MDDYEEKKGWTIMIGIKIFQYMYILKQMHHNPAFFVFNQGRLSKQSLFIAFRSRDVCQSHISVSQSE